MSTRFAELVHWMQVKDAKYFIPACADIDLTNICNQDCFYCSTLDFRKEKPVQLEYQVYVDLITKLASWRDHSPNSIGTLSTVVFSGGGEPTLLKGYEKVIEHTIDQGLLAALITNASKLDKLLGSVAPDKIKKLMYIGVDIDAGSKDLYEQIRRSKVKSTFDDVVRNVGELAKISNNVDFKVVLNDLNCTDVALEDIFRLGSRLKTRQIYFRPLYDYKTHYVFPIADYVDKINSLAEKHGVRVKINLARGFSRQYSRCHQMFLFPVFCADGNIYTCCENKGNPRFSIGSWLADDFRDAWLGTDHHRVYNSINTNLCHPCRLNDHNNNIQRMLDDPELLEELLM